MELGKYCRRKEMYEHMIEEWQGRRPLSRLILRLPSRRRRIDQQSNTYQKKELKRLEMGIKVKEKSPVYLGCSRGRKIEHTERLKAINRINEACVAEPVSQRLAKCLELRPVLCNAGVRTVR